MTLRFLPFSLIISLLTVAAVFGQADTFIGQFTDSTSPSFIGSMSGDGRFVVFESSGNLATENPRNEDGNIEIFLWDYAQRRIFQITDTKSVLFDPTKAAIATNIRVAIANRRPVISNDGRWIAFGSNATDAYPGDATHPPVISSANPGNFNGNALTAPTPTPVPTPTPTTTPSPTPTPTPAANPLTIDANMEMWIYQIPAYSPADLSAGDELPLTNLSGGTFIRVTNTVPSRLPEPGSAIQNPFFADDNHDPSISDDGSVVAFVSTRNLVPSVGNDPATSEDNDEIFTYTRPTQTLGQVTKTPRGNINNPIYSKNPTISGDGSRVVFASTGDGPIVGMTPGDNPSSSRNEEIFYADLVGGSPTADTVKKQVTKTTPATPGGIVNILEPGRRMSRDGRYIAFDSFAELEGGSGTVSSFALYVYDTTGSGSFRKVGPRSDADSSAAGGDVFHFPGFTDYDSSGRNPATLVLDTRLNIKADGTVPSTAADGLNNVDGRPAQVYTYTLSQPAASATFTRLTSLPAPSAQLLPTPQPYTSDTSKRIVFNLAFTEIGTGNPDLLSEGYYILKPDAVSTSTATYNLFTGASKIAVSASPVPTPSPTPTPAATPTPTPVTPSAVFGLSPGSLAIMEFTPGGQTITARTAVGSLRRSFELPIELSGVSLSINGIAAGLKHADSNGIVFVIPPFLTSSNDGTSYPLVINNNGTVIKGKITIVPARPDIFTTSLTPGPGGRALATNVTNRVPTTEPFVVHTVKLRGGQLVPTVIRLRVTGIANTAAGVITIRIGDKTINGAAVLTGGIEESPGVYTVDFTLPPTLAGAGDQPIIVSVTVGNVTYTSRLDDTAPRLSFL